MEKRNATEPKMLLVEGTEDLRVIPHLMEANGVPWGQPPPVFIEPCGGFDEMAKEGLIETEFKASGLKVLGIVADGNDSVMKRWSSLRNRCLGRFPGLPEAMPVEGLIQESESGLRFGVWLMPDNRSHGMMETFLTHLVRDESDSLLGYAESACKEARDFGAPYKETHAAKANIHTWLAWQDPPGLQLHTAVEACMLDACSPHAAGFVKWFRALYGV